MVPTYSHTNHKGKKFYLNTQVATLRGGREQRIYYFTKDERDTGCGLPDGFVVNENQRNGFLSLKRK